MFNRFAPIATLPTPGLIANPPLAWYPLDGPHASGGAADVRSLIPGQAAGTRSSTTTCVWSPTGPRGSALSCTGGHVTLPNLGLTGTVPFTVSAWLTSTATGLQEFFSFGTTGAGCELLKDYPSSGNLSLYAASAVRLTVSYPVPAAGWHLVTFTSDGANCSFFVDGILAGTAAYVLTVSSFSYAIGYSGPQAAYPWQGQIADVKVYPYAASAAQVHAEFSDPSARRHPAPNAGWLAGATSTPVYSGSGSPSLSALTASSSVSYSPPVYSGSGTPSLSTLSASASASYADPVYSGSGTPALGNLVASATVSYATPVYSGSGAPSLSALVASASVSYATAVYSGSGSPTLAALTASSSVSYAVPIYSGSGSPSLSLLTSSASVGYAAPVYAGSGSPALSAVTASASVVYADPGFSGFGAPSLGTLTATASVAYAGPVYSGSGSPALSALAAASVVAYVGPGSTGGILFAPSYWAASYWAAAYWPGLVVTPALVMAGWSSIPLADDTDPFGVDPDQTIGIN